jgi:hypothetical protein
MSHCVTETVSIISEIEQKLYMDSFEPISSDDLRQYVRKLIALLRATHEPRMQEIRGNVSMQVEDAIYQKAELQAAQAQMEAMRHKLHEKELSLEDSERLRREADAKLKAAEKQMAAMRSALEQTCSNLEERVRNSQRLADAQRKAEDLQIAVEKARMKTVDSDHIIQELERQLEDMKDRLQDSEKGRSDLQDDIKALREDIEYVQDEADKFRRKLSKSERIRKTREAEVVKVQKRFEKFAVGMHLSFSVFSDENADLNYMMANPEEIHIFIDHSNLFYGSRMIVDEHKVQKKDIDIFVKREEVSNVILAGREAIDKHVFGSADDVSSRKRLLEAWQSLGYTVHIEYRTPGSHEQTVDDMLAGEINNKVAKRSSKKENRKKTLVVVTGDGNDNNGRPSIFEAVGNALSQEWKVELWGWEACTSQKYKEYKAKYPGAMSIFSLDDHRERITYRRRQVLPGNFFSGDAHEPGFRGMTMRGSKIRKARPLNKRSFQ